MKAIVTTTINPPTEALRRFSRMSDWALIVVGDLKTPKDWYLPGALYLSPEVQSRMDYELSDAIGWNCIQRRNFGLIFAKQLGADVVAVVDDDNIPYERWGLNLMVDREVEVNRYKTCLPVFDPVGVTNYPHLWHRGFPLQLISKRFSTRIDAVRMTPDIQADFWNGEPDIDAICRLEHAPNCYFQDAYFPMASNAMSPFNSQNTFLSGRILKDYFLFPGIGRMDDIWASYYIQSLGARVVYGEASVYQKRNEHNLITDMKNEYLGYEHNLELVEAVSLNPESIFRFLPEGSKRLFELYRKHF